jgi:hypothetical protein
MGINCHPAGGMTRKVEVAWIQGGNKTIVWGENKSKTESGHAEIMAKLKSAQ